MQIMKVKGKQGSRIRIVDFEHEGAIWRYEQAVIRNEGIKYQINPSPSPEKFRPTDDKSMQPRLEYAVKNLKKDVVPISLWHITDVVAVASSAEGFEVLFWLAWDTGQNAYQHDPDFKIVRNEEDLYLPTPPHDPDSRLQSVEFKGGNFSVVVYRYSISWNIHQVIVWDKKAQV